MVKMYHIILVNCNIANNDYQQDLRDLYKFVPNQPFGQFLEILPANFIFLKYLIQTFKLLKHVLQIKTVNH